MDIDISTPSSVSASSSDDNATAFSKEMKKHHWRDMADLALGNRSALDPNEKLPSSYASWARARRERRSKGRKPKEGGIISSTNAKSTGSSSPSPMDELNADESVLSKITGRPCGSRFCIRHREQELTEAHITHEVKESLNALEAVLAEHGEDEYTAKCRERAATATDTAINFSRGLDETLMKRRLTINDRATDGQMLAFKLAAKRARSDHADKIIANTNQYLDSIRSSFGSTIEKQEGVAELEARLSELTRPFLTNSTKARSGPLRTVHESLKWLHSPEKKKGKETRAQTAERIGKRPKRTATKTGKKASAGGATSKKSVRQIEEAMEGLAL